VDAAEHAPLELQAAADELGVHYQTAYRWVRTGRLPAQLVHGRYLVERSSIDALEAERVAPRRPPAPSTIRLDRAARSVHEALVAGDEQAVGKIARRLVDEGASVTELIQAAFVPSLLQIGQAWHDGDLAIWVEHRATAIVERVLGELSPNPRGRRRGTAVVAAVSGDHHSLPTTMAALALRDDNWRVEHLGADIPLEQITHFCDLHDVSVAVITSTNPRTSPHAAEAAQALIEAGTPAIVGRPGGTLDDMLHEARQVARSRKIVAAE
jgi:excisionase family DNA binding protein